ncbi:MAG TPA: hypothetical protein VMZ28_09375 [Kofleriaceae bacterium]|nr:hypothetical protein [Kofleriaceae bacterium]
MTEPEPLQREVLPVRRWLRRVPWRGIGLAACGLCALGVSAGVVVWLALPGEVPPGAARAPEESPPVAAIELPDATRASDDPIGAPVATVEREEDDGGGWRGVAAAPDQYGVLALWTEREVWLSRDDGRSFAPVLGGPEPVGAVAVGQDARVWVARHGGRVGALSPGGHASWSELGYEQALALAAQGARVALLALHRDRDAGLAPLLWISEDHGRSWNAVAVPAHGDRGNLLRLGDGGGIDLLVRRTSEACDAAAHIEHYRGRAEAGFLRVGAREEPQPFALGLGGDEVALAWRGDRTVVAPFELEVDDWDVTVGTGPARTLVAADGRLVELDAAGQVRAAWHPLPGRPDGLAGDALERTTAIIGRRAVRHSSVHGWRLLFEAPRAAGVSLHGE